GGSGGSRGSSYDRDCQCAQDHAGGAKTGSCSWRSGYRYRRRSQDHACGAKACSRCRRSRYCYRRRA
ncbi:MAG: hypothetical protein IJH79_16115, partial [Lentisphaeria bacterium]|nr:hypothetical protein [Lentisphaeria bacterium]